MHKSVRIFGEKLSAIIDAMPFDTIGMVAEKSGYQRESISRFKNARIAKISKRRFPKIAEALGRDPVELLKEIGVPQGMQTGEDMELKAAAQQNDAARKKSQKHRGEAQV